ncbi:response regulator transcription factor [Nesterenkonia muleiensis]|uniref:response regulator transcription factor n=1 Tax=Nesterenkonia muleiensis TaxID=2282648 RepID=UPI001300B79B|nr:LuxR C-terminal-related transcriptional regulator [Nesterenkonia muleiensis]
MEVEAWSRVSWARTVAQKFSYQGTLVRQAIDLAFLTGQWERGWDYARLSENAELPRDEQVGVWSKAALLAWERGWDGYARWFGRKALRATTAVSIPWVRLYGYLGGVIAAAAGAGAVRSALDSYVRCVTTEEHATRSHRALQAGLIGLEAGCGPDEVRHFISRALPDHGEDLNHHAQRHYGYPLIVEATLREAEGRAQDRRILDASPSGVYQVNRARQHLLVARVHLKEERKLSALTELQQARHLLKAWPGRVLNTVEHETISSVGPLMVTPSQRKVLDLLVEGWGNRRIAEHLGLSERTIAVHVGTMLKRSKATSRTELVAQEMVRRLARQ